MVSIGKKEVGRKRRGDHSLGPPGTGIDGGWVQISLLTFKHLTNLLVTQIHILNSSGKLTLFFFFLSFETRYHVAQVDL